MRRGEVRERAVRTRREPAYLTVRRASAAKEKRSHGGRIACCGVQKTPRGLPLSSLRPGVYSSAILSSTGTTGRVVKMRLAPSTSTANPVYSPCPGALQRTVPAKSVVSVAVNSSSMNHDRRRLLQYRAAAHQPARHLPVALQRNRRLLQYRAAAHQRSTIASAPRLRSAAAVRIPPFLRRAGNSASRVAGPVPTPVTPTPGTR